MLKWSVFVYYAGCPNPDPDHPDFAPSQHLGPESANPTTSAKRAADKQGRYHRAVRRRQLHSAASPGPEPPEPEIVPDIEDNQEEEGNNQDNGGQCHLWEMLQQEVHRLRLERDFYKDKLSKLSISSENVIVAENDAAIEIKRKQKLFSFYFGLPSFAAFIWILNLIALAEVLRKNMPQKFNKRFKKCVVIIDCTEFFIDGPFNLRARAQTWSNYKHHNTLKALIRHFRIEKETASPGLEHLDLGFRFGVSSACVSNVINEVIPVLAKRLQILISWPSAEVLRKNMPQKFNKRFKKCVVIIDCTEFFIDRPFNSGLEPRLVEL
ncbi:hypothetical protein N1851_020501 [Merluccius polli]|uniref:DDE Tnp4 domain-containing protein n=1 Tax=Merluccius polli TaxID=89951 RepID=A0AA47MK55_MERPO|nr:hypothetical protein N1851_020501 [Merluccius polli]